MKMVLIETLEDNVGDNNAISAWYPSNIKNEH
jgi:hypothetical protein